MSKETDEKQQADELPASLRTTAEAWQLFLRELTKHLKRYDKS